MQAKRITLGLVATLSAIAGGLAVSGLDAAPPTPAQPWIVHLETNWDRPGGDYNIVTVGDDPAECQALCVRDGRCASFSYARRTAQGSPARCFLKNGFAPRVANSCCISGVKFNPRVYFDIDENIDRPGGDSQVWAVGSAIECRNLCQNAGPWCVAWSRARGSGQCYLKTEYRAKGRSDCCDSGVVRPYPGPAYY